MRASIGAAVLASAACSGAEAALEVGPVSFAEEEVWGLGEGQLRGLARLTAVGLAVRADDPHAIGAPLLEARRREARTQRLREEVALERAQVSEAALRVHYESRPEWELEVRHLVVLSERWRTQAHRDDARRRAQEARDRVLSGEPFAEVAGEVSEEPGAGERGGLLQPGREGTWVGEFWDAAAALEPGEISSVVETEYGFHVLRLDGRREVPFDEARDRVASEVAVQVADRPAWEAWVADRVEARFGADPPEDPEAAREEALSAEVETRGISLPASTEARIEREWERTVAGWSATFGFEQGMSLAELRDRALSALTGTGQNLRLAREEVDRLGWAIDGAFPVRGLEEPGEAARTATDGNR